MKKIFESNRLIFKRMSEVDFEPFCEMDMDPEVMKFYTSRKHGTREDALASFQRYMDYQALYPDFGAFSVYEKCSGSFVGLGVIIHLELKVESGKFEVGYRLPQKHWGKGFATEICDSILCYGFEDLKLKEIFGTTNPGNVVSQKVLLKSGMESIGDWDSYGGSKAFRISSEMFNRKHSQGTK